MDFERVGMRTTTCQRHWLPNSASSTPRLTRHTRLVISGYEAFVARLAYESVAARTQGNNLTPPGGAIGRITVTGGDGPLAGRGPGAEGALILWPHSDRRG